MTTKLLNNAIGVKPVELVDPGDGGALPLADSWVLINLISGGAETRTLGRPQFDGQVLQLNFKTDGGDVVLTCSTTLNQTGNTQGTFADAGDILVLIGGRNGADLEWKILLNDGVALL